MTRLLPFASLRALAVALPLALACAHPPTATTVGGTQRVLFIGNSLTYVHDVPALVVAIARQMGDTELATAMVAFPDFALEDHWSEGSARRALGRQPWEFVVMQQGPSSLPENQVHLDTWSQRFAPAVRAAGATPVLYQVWPQVQRRADAPAVLVSYARAAKSVGGRLAPAGAAWDSVLASSAPPPLYAGDGLHASPYGAWLAAAVIYSTIRRIDPATLPDTLPAAVGAPPLAPATVRSLLARASAAMGAAPR